MITLFIDTCHHNLIVSLYKDIEQLAHIQEDNDNHLSERLLPLIDKIINQVNMDINSVDRIIVANGPGSFTGVRIGVAVAKTLAYGIGCDIYTVSELQVMATTPFSTKYIVPLIDARRDAVYAAMYDDGLNSVIEDAYIPFEELLTKIKKISNLQNVTFVSYECFEQVTPREPAIDLNRIIGSENLIKKVDCHLVNPNYLKRTEAEEKLEDKQ